MARLSEEDYKAKKDRFIEAYLATGNQSEAARQAGYSPKDAHKRGSELMKDEYVAERISKYQSMKKNLNTDGIENIEDIFESTGALALRSLADAAKTDEKAAKNFLELKLKYEARKSEELGEYEGLSTAEIIREFDRCVEEGKEIKARIMETIREAEVPE